MQIERKNINSYLLTLSPYELAAFISSIRWIADGAQGELTSEAIANAKAILSSYDKAIGDLAKRDEMTAVKH